MSWCSRLLIPCAVGVVLVVSIWGGSLAHHRGLVGYDSDYYLRQAAFFVEGRGLYSLGELEPEPFTTWPLGYPLAIASAAKLTGLSVFWAAKVRGGPRNSDSLLRWDPDPGEGVWHATEETELSG